MTQLSQGQQHSSPDVLHFTAALFQRDGTMLLEIPNEVSAKLTGMEKVEGMINTQPFRAVIELEEKGTYLLHVGVAMMRGADAQEGDTVQLAILGHEPDPVPPADLQREFELSPEAIMSWQKLTILGRRDWIRWIEGAKTVATRARRITRTIDQLSEGKRRACCVDVNSFMMCRIKEDAETRTTA